MTPAHWQPLEPEEAHAVPDYSRDDHPLRDWAPSARLTITLAILDAIPWTDRAGFTFRDLAELAGVSEATVRTVYEDALARAQLHARGVQSAALST